MATLESMQETMQSMIERDQIIGIFGRHVSPEVANRLLHAGGDGEKRSVSILFLDIRGFTEFSEKRSPEEIFFEFLNRLFGFIIEIVHRNNGIINKFLGDGLMAVFGAPIDSEEHRRESVQAALDILGVVEGRMRSREIPAFKFGVGIHSGEAMTGNVGSETRMEYAIIGDVVNVASRLEKATKTVGARLLISGDVYAGVAEEARRNLVHKGRLKVRGRDQSLLVYGIDWLRVGPVLPAL